MGVKSTFEIKRETAIEIILNKIYDCTNEELARMLEAFKESEYRNYWIVDEFDEDKYCLKIENSDHFAMCP